MPVFDKYARITPYELLLPREDFASQWFPLIRGEAEERGGSLDDPDAFLLLSETAMALREIREEDDPAEMVQRHGALLFQAFHFWDRGHPLLFLDTEVIRFLVANGPEEGKWNPALPGKAGYVQFPQHMFWAVSGEEEAPESLDGIFWASPDGENVTILVVMGIRKERPGLGVVPLPTLPLSAAAPWASMQVRPEGEDFSTDIPGADLEGLYAIQAGGEAVKLAMRIFWYLDVFPGRVRDEPIGSGMEPPAGDPEPVPESDGPTRTTLPYRRVVLD